MRKSYFTKITFIIAFFGLISLYKTFINGENWLVPASLSLWVGGLLGIILSDVDHFIYIYYLKPQESTSGEVGVKMSNRNFRGSLDLLARTRRERVGHLFHSALFQIIFVAFTFFVVTSSGSLLGRGIVLGFALSLVVDQMFDFVEIHTINNWFYKFPILLDSKSQKYYLILQVAILFVIGMFF